jgi:hypothetical protein
MVQLSLQKRWTGFGRGVAFVLTNFNWRELVLQRLAFAGKYELPNRVTILGTVAYSVMGLSALKGFLVRPPFFSHACARAASDDGFFGVLGSLSALYWLYACWSLLRKGSDQNSQYPLLLRNHG